MIICVYVCVTVAMVLVGVEIYGLHCRLAASAEAMKKAELPLDNFSCASAINACASGCLANKQLRFTIKHGGFR